MIITLTAARRALLELLAMPRVITDTPVTDRLTLIQNYLDAQVAIESDTHSIGPERRPFDETRMYDQVQALKIENAGREALRQAFIKLAKASRGGGSNA